MSLVGFVVVAFLVHCISNWFVCLRSIPRFRDSMFVTRKHCIWITAIAIELHGAVSVANWWIDMDDDGIGAVSECASHK